MADVNGTYASFRIKNKDALKQWILYKLGYPTIMAEITDDQLDFCISDALEYFTKWVTYDECVIALDLANYVEDEGLTLPDCIVSVYQLDEENERSGLTNLGSMENIMVNYGLLPGTMASMGLMGGWLDYECAMQAIKFAKEMRGKFIYNFQFNEQSKKLILSPDPKKQGHYGHIVLRCDYIRDKTYLYGEDFVKRLALAYAKKIIGLVRTKFTGVNFPGGGSLNEDLLQEGKDEEEKLMEEIKNTYEPCAFFMN